MDAIDATVCQFEQEYLTSLDSASDLINTVREGKRDDTARIETKRGNGSLPGTQQNTGRLSRPPHPLLFTLLYEKQAERDQANLLPFLLQVDAAHVLMLASSGLLSRTKAAALLRVNEELTEIVRSGRSPIQLPSAHRGLYWLYEQEYIRRLGMDTGGAAHLGRSRNDINATVTRLRVRVALLTLLEEFGYLANSLIERAYQHTETFLCGFTHSQPAQPSTLAHYLTGLLSELMRSGEALSRSFDIVNLSPLGAAAGFGTSLSIDRAKVAQWLGFNGIIDNSTDAVGSRDYLVHMLSCMAMLGISLSRLATDLGSWSSAGYGFLSWPDDLVSTSSIMPQKRNAFVLENIRGQAIEPMGCLLNTLTGMKNVPFSNSVEVSADATAHFWPAIQSLVLAMKLTRTMLDALKVNAEQMKHFLEETQVTMTALADWLVVDHGMSFRSAHDAVSQLVNRCLSTKADDVNFILEEILKGYGLSVTIETEVLRDILDPFQCARRSQFGGGPAKASVEAQLRSLTRRCSSIEDVVRQRRRAIAQARRQLRNAQRDFVREDDCLRRTP
jgi:argininosuccinate lyase